MGRVLLRLRCTFTARSADFLGRLCDVDSSGASVNRCEGLLRVRAVRAPGGQLLSTADLGHAAGWSGTNTVARATYEFEKWAGPG